VKKPSADRITDTRGRISALQAERAAVTAQTRSRAECVTAIDALLDHWQRKGDAALAREAARLAAGQPAEFLTVKGTAAVASGVGLAPFALDLSALMVALLGRAAVRVAILDAIERVPEGLSADQRGARLREIEAELDELEDAEERLIESSEASNHPIARRPDARPEIVLAP
jgi:hypothetical protein